MSSVISTVLIDTSCSVHDIPIHIFIIVCGRLDQNDRWQKFSRAIGYENSIIDQLKQSPSPSSALLNQWSAESHTVTDLYLALYKLKEFRLMEHLRDLVDSSLRTLITSKSASFSSQKNLSNATTKRFSHHKKSKSTDVNLFEINGAKPIGIPQTALNDLALATNNWDPENVLGSGAFGTVYRGKWKCTDVAIKRINCHGYDVSATAKKRLKQVMIEMRFLNAFRHDNILPLYGYSSDGSSACLVYQMMACGSLEQRLRQKKMPLTYKQRLSIAIGTARGIQFLHTFNKRPTVHGDIKSANILLDSNLQPKIGDFGLAHQTNGQTKLKRLYGTYAYLADDFIASLIISTKNDVWAFGVVLFELATSLRSYDERRGNLNKLSNLMWTHQETSDELNDLIDSHAKKSSKKAQPVLSRLIDIGFSCTNKNSSDRPEMSDILNSLLDI